MNEELMITKEDLVNWLNRPPSNNDLDLIGFITTRLENFYKLEQENKQLKEKIDKAIEYNNYLLEHCRYKLNDGHLKKMKKILGAEQQEEYRLTKDENGTTQINGEWYKVEKIK